MSTLWTTITSELGKPDDQGDSWYQWTNNQLAHAFVGVLIGILFNIVVVFIVAIGKEAYDLYHGGKWKDSIMDVIFWSIGAFLTSAPGFITVWLLIFLGAGVYKRFKAGRNG